MTANLLASVVAIVQHELDRSRFPHKAPTAEAEADLITDLRCCAVDFQCIAMELDERFGIEVPDRFVEEGSANLWRTPADIARTVADLLVPTQPAPAGEP